MGITFARSAHLKTREERIAFWINLYNVIVMHDVIELGIRDSVKEVRSFFTRVQYIIGGTAFSPDDMEHGILMGNRRPPDSHFRLFGEGDGRVRYSIMHNACRAEDTLRPCVLLILLPAYRGVYA